MSIGKKRNENSRGGYQVELVHMGGHTPGHAGFLDKHNRIFFPGDDSCIGSISIGGGPDRV